MKIKEAKYKPIGEISEIRIERAKGRIGKRFGRMVIVSISEIRADYQDKYLCRCDCGNEKIVFYWSLVKGNTQSCGCLHKERTSKANLTHGQSKAGQHTVEYDTWIGMHSRCENPNQTGYEHYGGRGIAVCDRWSGEDGFKNFFTDMGKKPINKLLDRIDNGGNYEPSNCKWSTDVEQAKNRRSNRWMEHNGKRMILSDWARELGIKEKTLSSRLKYGLTDEEVLSLKVGLGHKVNRLARNKFQRMS